MLRICIPIQAKTLQELWTVLPQAEKNADLIEIWLDQIKDLDLPLMLKKVSKPLIVVCKSKKEQGKWDGDEKSRVEVLAQAAALGADFVDVGLHTAPALSKKIIKAKKPKTKIIISYHNFAKTPSLTTLKKTAQQALKKGADMVKIATYAKTKVDNYTIFELLTWFKNEHRDKEIIALCMGKNGQMSRIYGPTFGSFLTFAALDSKKKTAAGQLTVAEIKAALYAL